SDPFRFASPVSVTVSFGSQFCADDACALPITVTFSLAGWLAQSIAGTPFVFGELPLYDATNTYTPIAVGVKLTAFCSAVGYVPSPEIVRVNGPAASVLQLSGPNTFQVIEPP